MARNPAQGFASPGYSQATKSAVPRYAALYGVGRAVGSDLSGFEKKHFKSIGYVPKKRAAPDPIILLTGSQRTARLKGLTFSLPGWLCNAQHPLIASPLLTAEEVAPEAIMAKSV